MVSCACRERGEVRKVGSTKVRVHLGTRFIRLKAINNSSLSDPEVLNSYGGGSLLSKVPFFGCKNIGAKRPL